MLSALRDFADVIHKKFASYVTGEPEDQHGDRPATNQSRGPQLTRISLWRQSALRMRN